MNTKLFLLAAFLVLGLSGYQSRQVETALQVPSTPSTTPVLAKDQSANSITSAPLEASLISESIASTDQFLDNRSNPIQILKSYYNAINRKEYVRAYYYWGAKGNTTASQPPAYPQFEAGYANTRAVQLTTGNVQSEGAAGTFYFQVPVTLVATHSDRSQHTYVGCYTIRQPNPQNFGAPPFIPMSIYSAKIREVPSSSNTAVLMNQSCR